MTTKIERRIKIKYRVRNKISGTAERPRMSVFRSNKQIYVQVIDDLSGRTLAAASSLGMETMLLVTVDLNFNELWQLIIELRSLTI